MANREDLVRQLQSHIQFGTMLPQSALRRIKDALSAPHLEGVKLYLEHGWLTMRTERGWLLWSSKGANIPDEGFDLAEILKEVEKNSAADPHRVAAK